MKEKFSYRVRKQLCQWLPQITRATQMDRLQNTDWDILVILDACRVDALRSAATWPVDTVVSPASCTPEWLQSVAAADVFNEATIISGNPQYNQISCDIGFNDIEYFWERHWNTSLQTVLPEPILDRVTEVAINHSNSVVAHLQQPHWPYIAKLKKEWRLAYTDLGPWSIGNDETDSLQVAMQRGLVDAEKAKQAYKSSVQSIWKCVSEYIEKWLSMEKNIVITSDHGEVFGRLSEYGFYEHPCGCRIPKLVNVPWIEIKSTNKDIQSHTSVEEKLQALGYVE